MLTLFVSFFLLYDGARIWRWLVAFLPPAPARRTDRAGRAAWATLTSYVHGTVTIAVIHAVVIGLALLLLGVPLALPLAVLITFGTQGWLAALILLGVLLAENQLEAHLFQPLIVGRYLRLHPLAIGLALAVGTLLGGIVGAVVAVPAAAIIYRSAPLLRGQDSRE